MKLKFIKIEKDPTTGGFKSSPMTEEQVLADLPRNQRATVERAVKQIRRAHANRRNQIPVKK